MKDRIKRNLANRDEITLDELLARLHIDPTKGIKRIAARMLRELGWASKPTRRGSRIVNVFRRSIPND